MLHNHLLHTLIKPARAANSNIHDQFMWEFLHKYLDLWFTHNQIPQHIIGYNRAVHYMYELKNRPWLAEKDCTQDALRWLKNQAEALNYQVTWL